MDPLHCYIKETSKNTSAMALKNLVGNRKYPYSFVMASEPQFAGCMASDREMFEFDAVRVVT